MSHALDRRFGDALLARRLDTELLALFDHVLAVGTSAAHLWLGARLVVVRELIASGVPIDVDGAGPLGSDRDFMRWAQARYDFPWPPYLAERAME